MSHYRLKYRESDPRPLGSAGVIWHEREYRFKANDDKGAEAAATVFLTGPHEMRVEREFISLEPGLPHVNEIKITPQS